MDLERCLCLVVAVSQQFVGYHDMQKFVGHVVPTFPDADRVVLAGTSAGSFRAGMNFNQVRDWMSDVLAGTMAQVEP